MSAYIKPDMTIEAMLAPTKIALLEEELAECKVWYSRRYWQTSRNAEAQ
jgi:hypothetical protein